jgi:uncharacterized protein with PIN domain
VRDQVPALVYRRFRKFVRCGHCGRVYWRGTHFQRLQRLVARVQSARDDRSTVRSRSSARRG